ncbi:DUF4435 domain-containing protein [Winogradskyella litoriviva]|uniref:DUF4435 domain-containing protein n=1 Tax=Winogradskyella litoriviva TaxID=1220182 RepID=A0ABX2E9Q1_9FLAO|nr:DUF4435 domain-containing protein [Winogradskyella litoriviva]NRD24532.1 DUF4435 domain-containing protein [Winogradskyella litoriviva]
MEEFITNERIANSIMQNKSFKGYYLIVEGPKDSKLYGKFFNSDKVSIKEAFGNQRVQDIFKILTERGFDKKLGIIDSDFRKITGNEVDIDGIFMTDDHDIEVMIMKTKALDDVVRVFCSQSRVQAFEKEKGISIKNKIFDLGKEIGYLKLANKTFDLGLVFKPKNPEGNHLKYKNFICDKTLDFLGTDKMITTTNNYSVNKSSKIESIQVISERLTETKETEYILEQLVNGHDLSQILYILMKKVLKSRNRMLQDHNSIEDSLTLAYDLNDFKETYLYEDIQNWSEQREIEILLT